MNAIEIQNLKKIYKKNILAVDDFSMVVPESSIFGLLGPNGAGKSTIMNILAGIIRRTDGKISVLNKSINDEDYDYKRKVGFVLEKPHYIERLTVREYLEFCGSMYGIKPIETEKRTSELISFFDLNEKENNWIETCSTGMKKKVSLSAALIHQPKLLILDEPLEGLDPVSAKQIKENLRKMAERQITVVISSHNLDTVEKLCDEVAIINKGKLVLQVKTKEIRTRFKEEINQETYESLEELFVDIISNGSERQNQKKLSWL